MPSLRARLLLAAPLLVAALVTGGGVARASTSSPSVGPAPSVSAQPRPAGSGGTPDPVARALRLALVGAGVLAVLGLSGLYLTRERT